MKDTESQYKQKDIRTGLGPILRLTALLAVAVSAALMASCMPQALPVTGTPNTLTAIPEQVVPTVSTAASSTAVLPPETPALAVASEPIAYVNERLGLSMTFPGYWKDQYIIIENDNEISVYLKKAFKAGTRNGSLFTVTRKIGELYAATDPGDVPGYRRLFHGNGFTYYLGWPTDVPLSADYDLLHKEYSDVCKGRQSVYDSIQLYGVNTPTAVIPDYKVVGGTLFTVEIPKAWEIKASKERMLGWDFYLGTAGVGYIQIVNEKSAQEAADKNMLVEYVSSDSFKGGCAKIALNRDLDQTVMNQIKSQVTLIGESASAYNVLTYAKAYLNGGERLLGKIVNQTFNQDKIQSIDIELIENTADDNDGVYNIMQSGKMLTVSVSSAQALVRPKVYDACANYISGTLYNKYDCAYLINDSNKYYYFYINKGMLKAVIEH